MNLIRKAWTWLTTPRTTYTPDQLMELGQIEQAAMAQDSEHERKTHLATLPEQPDLSDDPGTDVPEPHLGRVRAVDLTAPVRRGQQVPSHLQDITPSDWELLTPDQKALFEQITPHSEEKIIRYPAPVEQTTSDWVSERLANAGYSEAYRLRFAGWRRVGVGMSMRHLGDLKRRAEARDTSLTPHDLIALRSRGIA